jgi:hypothetical protein
VAEGVGVGAGAAAAAAVAAAAAMYIFLLCTHVSMCILLSCENNKFIFILHCQFPCLDLVTIKRLNF